MKKHKLFLPILTFSSLVGLVTPLFTSCNNGQKTTKYTLTFTSGPHGQLEGPSTIEVAKDTKWCDIKDKPSAKPDMGYVVDGWYYNDKALVDLDVVTFNMNIEVRFKPQDPTPSTSFSWNLNTTNRTASIKQFIGSETDIIIPNEYLAPDGLTYSVTKIAKQAFSFYGCEKIQSIIMPNSIIEIETAAFKDCTGLVSITISNNVSEIADSLFSGCTSLSSIIIPDNVSTISENAFYGCTGLVSMTMGANATNINESAFAGCTGIKEITFVNGAICVAPPGSSFLEEKFKDSPVEKLSIIQGDIGTNAFAGCTGLTSVTIGSGVTSIGNSAFYGCTGLTSITIPDSVETISSYSFCLCRGLTTITIGAGVKQIGESVFYNCIKLTTVKYNSIYDNWKSINKGDSWKENCPATSVECTDGTYPIGS